jgi:hypothetical protein
LLVGELGQLDPDLVEMQPRHFCPRAPNLPPKPTSPDETTLFALNAMH